jgi:hypothetical protein
MLAENTKKRKLVADSLNPYDQKLLKTLIKKKNKNRDVNMELQPEIVLASFQQI